MFLLLMICSLPAFSQQFKVLLFTKTDGFHHESIIAGVEAIRILASRHHFALDWHENAGIFNDKALENYRV
ncbi:MAG TPA: ThuA domain-containing protein, partial [Anaerolineales bacterium]|nr:ThuA domain-containing protein [Anaerolineales bacterium]